MSKSLVLAESGLNPYDARIKCDEDKNGPLCYGQMGWIDNWMNTPANKEGLGVDPARKFESCNMEVNKDFMLQGDSMNDASLLLPDLINDGIRLLVYAGNAGRLQVFFPTYEACLTFPFRFDVQLHRQ